MTFVDHLFDLFKIPKFTATISFGDKKLQGQDRKELARLLKERILEIFVPVNN